uniref:Uncharacterized protein n=1 Tax=Lepeophtheirus salmonis TaxID=72036 RepID=A0A0K2V909_LEPSM
MIEENSENNKKRGLKLY